MTTRMIHPGSSGKVQTVNRPTIGQILTIGSLVAVLAIAASPDVSQQVTAIPTITPLATCASEEGGPEYPCVWDAGMASSPQYRVYYRTVCPVLPTDTVACVATVED
jgi:hypothetical protein